MFYFLQILGLCHTFDCRTYELPSTTKTDLDHFKECNKTARWNIFRDEDKENVDSNIPVDTNNLNDTSELTIKKHLMFFTGCPARLGCTVLLRGGNLSELRRVKKVVMFMVYALYSWGFERSYLTQERALISSQCLSDFTQLDDDTVIGGDDEENKSDNNMSAEKNFLSVSTEAPKTIVSPSSVSELVEDESDPLRCGSLPCRNNRSMSIMVVDDVSYDASEKNSFKKALNDVLISTSPYIKKPMPFWETELGSESPLRKFFAKTHYYSAHLDKTERKRRQGGYFSHDAHSPHANSAACDKVKIKPQHPFVVGDIWGADNRALRELSYADYRACGGQLTLANSASVFDSNSEMSHVNNSDVANCEESKECSNDPYSVENEFDFSIMDEEDLYTSNETENLSLKPWKWHPSCEAMNTAAGSSPPEIKGLFEFKIDVS